MALPSFAPSSLADPEGDLAFLAAMMPKENTVVKKLSQHIDKVWQANQRDNKNIRIDIIKALKRCKGEYEATKLQAIRNFNGTEIFIRSAENKARAADSWIKDIYRGDSDLPWELEPTEEPDLPDETMEEIKQATLQQSQVMEQQVMASGKDVDPNRIAVLMQEFYDETLEKAREKMKETAKDRCKRAACVIRDQNQEGGWDNAFKEFLYYFIRTKAGIIKGPTLTKKPKQIWQVTENGYSLEVTETLVNDVYCVSPFNFFPSRGMKEVGDGDIIELHELTRQSISSLIGVPGYSEEEIRLVLEKYKEGQIKSKWFVIDDETAVNQVTKSSAYNNFTVPPTQNSPDMASDTIWAQEFWGTVSGAMLIEWGAEGNIDPHKQYQANCWKIGEHVIKAVINPDNLGRKPYHVSSWTKNPEWIWGEGLVEFSSSIEDALNAITRALINNVAIASGPLVEIDKDRVDMRTPLYPWRQIESTSMQMKGEGPAVNYYQPQMHCGELIQAWQFFAKVLDEVTVPAYAQGASQSGVTAGTATVFTQLLAAASRSIKAVVANIDDDIITPYIQMCYDYNMKFSEDSTIKGDARVVAKGVSGLLAKEQQAQKKTEYLQVAANPSFSQVLGAKNIGSILAQVAKANDIILPDMDRLDGSDSAQQQLEMMLNAQAGIQQQPQSGNAQSNAPQQSTDPIQSNGNIALGGGAPTQGMNMLPNGMEQGVVNE